MESNDLKNAVTADLGGTIFICVTDTETTSYWAEWWGNRGSKDKVEKFGYE